MIHRGYQEGLTTIGLEYLSGNLLKKDDENFSLSHFFFASDLYVLYSIHGLSCQN